MGRCLNLVGKRYEKLLVSEKTDKRLGTSVVWKCQCDCGNITYASTSSLNSGHTRSCGCLHKQQCADLGRSKGMDLTNKVFNDLIVIEKTSDRKDGRIVWKCKCFCGQETYATTSDLTQGRKKHCEQCQTTRSLGEEKIIQLLKENNISFIREKTFKNLKNNDKLLRFDFYVNDKYLIEFDGKQHFIKDSGYGSELESIQNRDNKKNKYCFKNQIPLIRIPYYHLDKLNIEDLLLETSNFILKED